MDHDALLAAAETRRKATQADIDALIAWADTKRPSDDVVLWPERMQAAEVIGHLNRQLANISAEVASIKALASAG